VLTSNLAESQLFLRSLTPSVIDSLPMLAFAWERYKFNFAPVLIDALLGLPEFYVVNQVICPKWLEVHLERRDTAIVCPHCQTCCSRVLESQPRYIRDLPILEHPVLLWVHLRRFACQACQHRPWETSETFRARAKWTERLYHQVRAECLGGCPSRELARCYSLSEHTVFRWTFERSLGGRPSKLGCAIGIDEYAQRKGHTYNTSIVDLYTRRLALHLFCLPRILNQREHFVSHGLKVTDVVA
jgi:transposase